MATLDLKESRTLEHYGLVEWAPSGSGMSPVLDSVSVVVSETREAGSELVPVLVPERREAGSELGGQTLDEFLASPDAASEVGCLVVALLL